MVEHRFDLGYIILIVSTYQKNNCCNVKIFILDFYTCDETLLDIY